MAKQRSLFGELSYNKPISTFMGSVDLMRPLSQLDKPLADIDAYDPLSINTLNVDKQHATDFRSSQENAIQSVSDGDIYNAARDIKRAARHYNQLSKDRHHSSGASQENLLRYTEYQKAEDSRKDNRPDVSRFKQQQSLHRYEREGGIGEVDEGGRSLDPKGFSRFQGEQSAPMSNNVTTIKQLEEGFKADKESWAKDISDDKFIMIQKGTHEFVKAGDVAGYVKYGLLNDKDWSEDYKQVEELNLFNDLYNRGISREEAFDYIDSEKGQEEVQERLNIRATGLAEESGIKKGYDATTSDLNKKADPYAKSGFDYRVENAIPNVNTITQARETANFSVGTGTYTLGGSKNQININDVDDTDPKYVTKAIESNIKNKTNAGNSLVKNMISQSIEQFKDDNDGFKVQLAEEELKEFEEDPQNWLLKAKSKLNQGRSVLEGVSPEETYRVINNASALYKEAQMSTDYLAQAEDKARELIKPESNTLKLMDINNVADNIVKSQGYGDNSRIKSFSKEFQTNITSATIDGKDFTNTFSTVDGEGLRLHDLSAITKSYWTGKEVKYSDKDGSNPATWKVVSHKKYRNPKGGYRAPVYLYKTEVEGTVNGKKVKFTSDGLGFSRLQGQLFQSIDADQYKKAYIDKRNQFAKDGLKIQSSTRKQTLIPVVSKIQYNKEGLTKTTYAKNDEASQDISNYLNKYIKTEGMNQALKFNTSDSTISTIEDIREKIGGDSGKLETGLVHISTTPDFEGAIEKGQMKHALIYDIKGEEGTIEVAITTDQISEEKLDRVLQSAEVKAQSRINRGRYYGLEKDEIVNNDRFTATVHFEGPGGKVRNVWVHDKKSNYGEFVPYDKALPLIVKHMHDYEGLDYIQEMNLNFK